jgi:hypothetical protein
MMVVDGSPAELRPTIETELTQYFGAEPPGLHLMERGGYQALMAMLPIDFGQRKLAELAL